MAKEQTVSWCTAKWSFCDENIVTDNRNRERKGPHECGNETAGHTGQHVCLHCNRPK
jgi:hypothetical protein